MTDRISDTIVNSGHYQLLGTDRFDDFDSYLGKGYAEYRSKWNEYPKKRILSEFPLHLDIESTNACDLRCIMCSRNFMTEEIGHIEWELFRKVIDEGAKYRLPSVKLNYRGEPLLNPRLPEMVTYAKKKGIIEVQFNTNGLSLTREKTEKLLDAGLDRIIFSFDGATRETYERIRTGSDYEKVVNNIKTLVQIRNERGLKRPSVRVQMVKMKENEHEVEDFIRMWLPIANRVAISTRREPAGIDEEKMAHFSCPQIWQRLMICWDGAVRMCCGDWGGEIVLGNVKESTIYELWHSEKLNEIRRLHAEGRFGEILACARCEVNTPRYDGELQRLIARYK
ncbi:radical SAM/SPASM domain-containing protein [Chloroflexota bacterium]